MKPSKKSPKTPPQKNQNQPKPTTTKKNQSPNQTHFHSLSLSCCIRGAGRGSPDSCPQLPVALGWPCWGGSVLSHVGLVTRGSVGTYSLHRGPSVPSQSPIEAPHMAQSALACVTASVPRPSLLHKATPLFHIFNFFFNIFPYFFPSLHQCHSSPTPAG